MNIKGKILIVDDDSLSARFLAAKLKSAGYESFIANNGKEAMEMTAKEFPDLILLDIVMPEPDGYEVCQLLQSDPATQHIPIIFVSGRHEARNKKTGFELGAVDYITKPFEIIEVLSRVKTHLSLKFARQELKEQNIILEQRVSERTNEILKSRKKLEKTNIKLKQEINVRKLAEKKLRKREKDLKAQSRHLEEVNAALNVLLKKREKDKKELEENVQSSVKQLVSPYVRRLKKSPLTKEQESLVSILESNLNSVISPFSRTLSSTYLNFTPMEIKVANLIREGKRSKEMAELLGVAPGTILTHRHNLRKKLGLKNKKGNLRTHLIALG
ncbi:MAG: response regulator [Desulfobacterales bacterium]|nr:response regulator [Desulfobacterales bacterium]